MAMPRNVVDLLKQQWAASLVWTLSDVVDALPEGHHERPGLIRAIELIRLYGSSGPDQRQ